MPMPPAPHQIWGDLESNSGDSSYGSAQAAVDHQSKHHSRAASCDRSAASSRAKRLRNLPMDLQAHLSNVTFHNDHSRSSERPGSSVGSSRALARARSGGSGGGGGDADGAKECADGGQAPLSQSDARWSKGAALHSEGKCKPCHYVHTKLGCLNGQECGFCHLPHSAKSKPRPCKTKRLQCKRIVNMIEAAAEKDPQQFAEATKLLSNQSLYLRSVIQTAADRPAGPAGDGDEARKCEVASSEPQQGTGAVASLMSMLRGGSANVRAASEDVASI